MGMPTVVFYYNEDGVCELVFSNMPVKFIYLRADTKEQNKKNIMEVTVGSEKRKVVTPLSYLNIPVYEDWVEKIESEIEKHCSNS